MEINGIDQNTHTKLAKDLFNLTWDFIEKTDRTKEDNETMLYAANASRFHWGFVGTPLNFARGEWQISRVYALLGRSEPALHHAENSLEVCIKNELGDFDLGFAHEAMARAYSVQGNAMEYDKHMQLAEQTAKNVTNEENQKWLLKNIETVQTNTIPVF